MLVATYNEHLCRCDAYGEAALCSIEGYQSREKPFTALLRSNLGDAFLHPENAPEDAQGWGPSIVAFVLARMDRDNAREYVLACVDAFLESVKTDQLESIMYNIVLDDVLQQGIIHNPLLLHKMDKDKRPALGEPTNVFSQMLTSLATTGGDGKGAHLLHHATARR